MKKLCILIFILFAVKYFCFELQLEKVTNIQSIQEIPRDQATSSQIEDYEFHFRNALREEFYQAGSQLEMTETDFLNEPNKPILPQKNIHITLPGNYFIEDVAIENGSVEEYHTFGILKPAAKLLITNGNENQDDKLQKDVSIYNKNEFYPQKWLDFDFGYDGKKTHVFIHVYPVQWNPVSKKTLLLRNFRLAICGELQIPNSHFTSSRFYSEAEHLLLTPDEWIVVADSMAAFHDMSSEAVKISDIYNEYPTAEEPTEDGWAIFENEDIHDYQYENALKIISFLQDSLAHPNLDHITLLGSAEIIPPSYYFAFRDHPDYESWLPSDLYYASPDYDWVDNFHVARLPVHDLTSLSNYFTKMQNFVLHSNEAWTKNAIVSGGQTWETSMYYGEFSNNQLICDDVFDGFEITKLQEMRGTFLADIIQDHWINDDFLFYFNFSHGGGYSIKFGNETFLTRDDIALFPAKERCPIIVDKACWNGVFDTFLYDHHLFDGISLCETVLSSPGAGIAYVAATRASYGQPITNCMNGNILPVDYSSDYELLYYFLDGYRNIDAPTFGRLFTYAKMKFMENNNLSFSFYYAGALLRFMVHANSALTLPVPEEINSETEVPLISLENGLSDSYYNVQFAGITPNDNPCYLISDDNLYDLLSYQVSDQFLINLENNVTQKFVLEGDHFEKLIMNRFENTEAKEAWHLSMIIQTAKTINGDISDWNEFEIVGGDESGEITSSLDLSEVFASYDETTNFVTFALPVNVEIPQVENEEFYYCIAIDDAPFGFTNNINHPGEIPVDLYLGFENAAINKLFMLTTFYNPQNQESNANLNYYDLQQENTGLIWQNNYLSFPNIRGLYAVSENAIEFTIDADSLNLDNCRMAVFSSYNSDDELDGVFADVIPTSLQNPSAPMFGLENAFYLRDYIDLSKILKYSSQNKVLKPFVYSNFPNPFNENTMLKFEVYEPASLKIKIYNIRGQKVRMLKDEEVELGLHFVNWDGCNDNGNKTASGLYLINFDFGTYSKTKKCLFIK